MAEENLEMSLGWEALFALENGNSIFLQNSLDDPDYAYNYYLFGPDRQMIDGGCFNVEGDPKSIEEVLEAALQDCSISKNIGHYRLDDGSGSVDLEDLGYEGF